MRTLCKHCKECESYEYKEYNRNGNLVQFTYCNGNKFFVDANTFFIHQRGYPVTNQYIYGRQRYLHTLFKKDAKKARTYFEKNGWSKCLNERLKFSYKQPKYLIWLKSREVWQIRKKINGKLIIFGQFKRIEDAEEEVKLLKKVNWDIQSLCDLSSDGDEFTECLRHNRSL